MGVATVAISSKLTNGVESINLVVHRLYRDQSSPCVVIENGNHRGIGGHVISVEEIFADEIAKHPGFIIEQIESLSVVSTEKDPEFDYLRWRTKLESWNRVRSIANEPCWLCDEIGSSTTYQSPDLSRSQDWSYDICRSCERSLGLA